MFDLINFLAGDPLTKVIIACIEGVSDRREFMGSIRKALKARKLVGYLKAGKSIHGAKSVTSHTDSLTVSYGIYETSLKQFRALIVNNVSEVIIASKALSMQPSPGEKGRYNH